jgi:asparagine synthase (glutamine-hydrolysing)
MIPYASRGKTMSYYLSQDHRYVNAGATFWKRKDREKYILNNHHPVDYANASELFKKRILKNGSKNDFITNLQYLDLQTYLVDDILTKVDRASMLNSLEVRVPLLDHKFAELTFRIPSNMKFKGKERKYIFKKSMTPYLPESILTHPKQGFGIPISLWFKDNLKSYVNDTFNANDCLLYNYLDKKLVWQTVLNNERSGSPRWELSEKIWALLFFNEWLKQNQ